MLVFSAAHFLWAAPTVPLSTSSGFCLGSEEVICLQVRPVAAGCPGELPAMEASHPGRHLGSRVGSRGLRTQSGSFEKIKIGQNLGASVEPPWRACPQRHTFPSFKPTSLLLVGKQARLSFAVYDPYRPRPCSLRAPSARVPPCNFLRDGLCLPAIVSWPGAFMLLTTSSKKEICWLS